MSLVSAGAYEGRMSIPAFIGLRQDGDQTGLDPRYATRMENADTTGGVLAPCAIAQTLDGGDLGEPIETLMALYRRRRPEAPAVLVAASGGGIYAKIPGEDWKEARMPEGVGRFIVNEWSWASYEINRGADGEPLPEPADVLILSNAEDGMVLLREDGDGWALDPIAAPGKFGMIERYAERIWGTGDPSAPDTLYYSRAYNPYDWTQVSTEEIAQSGTVAREDGGGSIDQPSWDGDSFLALKSFGAHLIAFKKSRAWRVMGVSPGEFTLKEQFGGGTRAPQTISAQGDMILMLGGQGVEVYDGNAISPFRQGYCKTIWTRMNRARIEEACACVYRGRYYLAIPVDGSDVNNTVVIFDTQEGSWTVRTDLSVESWLVTGDALYFTSAQTPNAVMAYCEPGSESGAVPGYWISGWQDFGKKMHIGPFELVMTCEARADMWMTIHVNTDKRKRQKRVRIRATDEWDENTGGKAREVRVPIQNWGKRFRLELHWDGASAFRMTGGVQLLCDVQRE